MSNSLKTIEARLAANFPDPVAVGVVPICDKNYAWVIMPGRRVYLTKDADVIHEIDMDWKDYWPVGCTCADFKYRGEEKGACKHMLVMIESLLVDEAFMKHVYVVKS